MSGSHIADDIVTLALLGSLVLLVASPIIYLVASRITGVTSYRVASFRWLYLAWACLLVASSVWSFSRDVRLSVEEAGADSYARMAVLLLGVLIISFIGVR